ncbi:HAD family hydrolase [Paenibacillus sp. J31TS4]|uniref:HAD family hydrolase n=1 Tax=Paenibacillus sp. J31TS4 TaxID=2807195 RepID=UPI001BCCBF97|nr:HAD family hydrolase [Paenibacillus sp. J31TS4]
MAVKAVLFDLDDTLLWDERSVKEAFEATCRFAAESYPELNAERLEEKVKAEARQLYESYETYPFTKMIGINPFEAMWGRFAEGEAPEFRKLNELAPGYRREAWTRGLQAAGVDDAEMGARLAELFPEERRARPLVYEETFEVLEELKKDYRLLLLTNGSPDLQQEKLDGFPELAAYFDHIVISGVFGKGKPDASIFRYSMELLGIQPDEGLMVGDKLTTDILGSNTVGMRNAWMNRHGLPRTDEIVPTFEIKSLRELTPLLNMLNR